MSGSPTWVREHMPEESALALAKFVEINPHWRGAGWDDCLETLLDSDSHLDVTEPLYGIVDNGASDLPAAIAITLLYASQAFSEASKTDKLTAVLAAIRRHS